MSTGRNGNLGAVAMRHDPILYTHLYGLGYTDDSGRIPDIIVNRGLRLGTMERAAMDGMPALLPSMPTTNK